MNSLETELFLALQALRTELFEYTSKIHILRSLQPLMMKLADPVYNEQVFYYKLTE